MKKLLLFVGIVLAAIISQAQPFRSVNFLNVDSIIVTNALSFTNLAWVGSPGYGSNIVGLIFTNAQGSRVTVAAGDATAIVGDIPLWSDRNATAQPTAGAWVSNNLANICFQLYTPTNSTYLFQFTPLWDGTRESTAAADIVSILVTGTSASDIVVAVPFNASRWQGTPGKMRLRSITDTNAVMVAGSGRLIVKSVTLNGFRP